MIDHHCHPFALEPGPLDLDAVTLDLVDTTDARERRRRDRAGLLWYELLRNRLAEHLACGIDEVDEAREETARRDYPGYVRALFADVDVRGLVVDPAWSDASTEQVRRLEDVSGCSVHLLLRIDAVVDELLTESVGFDELVARFDAHLERSVREGYRGLKTVLAYRTGLAVDPEAGAAEARRALTDASGSLPRRAKPLRDFLLRRALGFAADSGLPVQIHTGIGDSDLRLSDAGPLLLENLLRTPEGSAATIVLIHGSFPYHEEAAFLCATRPNVHVDFSLFNLFAPAGVAERLLRIVDLAPVTKVLAGTDGHGMPESHWFAAVVARDAWQQVRDRLAGAGASKEWLDRAQQAVFSENVARLYRL